MTTYASLRSGCTRTSENCIGFGQVIAIIGVLLASVTLSNCAGYTSNASGVSGSGAGNSGGGVLTASPVSVAFGNVAVGSSSTQSVSVTNTGTGAVNLSGFSISGGVFTVTGGNPSSSLAVGKSATVQVQFAPTSTAQASGSLTVTSDATDSSLGIALTGTGMQAIPSFSPSSLNFNNIVVGQTGTQSVTLGNTGNAGLTISAATVSGTGFSMSGLTLPATIAPQTSTTFTVSFSPASTSGSTGSITFTDNGPGSSQSMTLTGSAVAANTSLTANPGSFNFGNVVVGTSSTQPITLTNTSSTTITVGSVASSGAGFSASGVSNGQTIGAGATATLNVSFSPTTAGAASGSIAVSSSATNSPLVITLGGTGTQGALAANPSSINFGPVLTGTSSSVNITLTNSGTSNVAISGASASGTGFSIGTLTAQTLTPGQTATITATFSPTSTGSANGSISVASNAPGSPLTIGLSGSGVSTQAQLGISPSSVAFGNVNVGSSLTNTVTLTNTGNITLNITAATITGAGYTMTLAPMSINAGANVTFNATFTPTSGVSSSGSVSITSNAPNSPATIALTGTGVQAQGAASPSSIAFGAVTIGNTDSQQITLHNSGNATLTVSQITVAGAGFGQTGLSTSTTIPAGGSVNFNATYAPTTSGSASGSITLATNGAPSSLVIGLSGSGQVATMTLGASPTSLSFGNVLDQTSSSLTTSITNTGNASVTISAVTTTGAGFSASGITNGTVLTAGQSVTLTVTFAPMQGGAVSGAGVTIASNATNSPLLISLGGAGQHSMLVSWGASSTPGVTYNVFRGTTSGSEATTPINTAPIASLSYTDTNVTAGQQYFYTIEAVDASGSSDPSPEASATVPTP